MNEFKAKIAGTVIIGWRKLRPVSIAELRNNLKSDSSEVFDSAADFYFTRLLDALAENSFDLNLYEETKKEAEKHIEIKVIASQEKFETLLSSLPFYPEYENYALLKSADLIEDYSVIISSFMRNCGSAEIIPDTEEITIRRMASETVSFRRSEAV